MLVGLAAAEAGRFDLEAVVDPAGRDDAEGDVGRVEPVVGDGRLGAIHRAHPVHEGGRAEGRFAGQADIGEQTVTLTDGPGVAGRQLHDQFVRMLAIDQRTSVREFARRGQVRIAARAHQRFEAVHRAQLDMEPLAQIAIRHHHRHRLHERLASAARAAGTASPRR